MTTDAARQTPAIARGTGPSKAARSAFMAFAVLAVMVFAGIAVGANVRAPGVIGLAATVVGGLSAAVLTLAAGGLIALKLAATHAATPEIDTAGFDPALAPALADLATAQHPITRRMIERSSWRTPLFASAAIAAWSVLVLLGAPGGVFDFSIILLGGGLAGYGWSHREAARELADLYLQRGVNTLAATQAGLGWRKPAPVDLSRLRSDRVLVGAASLTSSGEIAGAHRGVALRIVPVKTRPLPDQASNAAGAFTGLLIELEAPHLNVASMEEAAIAWPRLAIRISHLGSIAGFGAPISGASSGRIAIALPETSRPRVFDPPSGAGAKAAAPRLMRVQQVIAAATSLADAVAAPAGDTLQA